MKLRSSTKIAIGFVVIVGGAYAAMRYAAVAAIENEHFNPVLPGPVDLVGIDPNRDITFLSQTKWRNS